MSSYVSVHVLMCSVGFLIVHWVDMINEKLNSLKALNTWSS